VAKGASGKEDSGALKRTEQTVLDKAATLDLIIEATRLGLCLINEEKRIVWVNRIFEEWFGPLDALEGKPCHEVYEQGAPECPADKVFETGEVHQSVTRRRTKDDEYHWFKLTLTAVRDEAGRVSHILEIVEDITVQKTVEDELEHTETVLETIFEGVQAGLILIDAQGVILKINQYMSHLFGLAPEDIVGKECTVAFKGMPFLCTQYDSRKFKDLKDPLERQVKGKLSNGKEIILEDIIHPTRGPDNHVIGFIELVVDVTSTRQMEEKVFEAEKLKALRTVVGTVGHEINNPLQIILNLTSALEDLLSDKRVRKTFVKNALRAEFQSMRGKLDTIREQARKAGGIGRRLVEEVDALPPEKRRRRKRPPRKAVSKRRKAKTSILVVDDERDIRKYLAAQLKRRGYQVETAKSASEVLEKVKQNTYHIIVADIVMPEMNGCELYNKVKEHDESICVILMTGFAYDTQHSIARINERCLEAGLPLVKPIYKPVKMNQLLNRIEAHLSQKKPK
jgi:PAS domain S-box-containing protein